MNLIFYTFVIEVSKAIPVSHKENRKEGCGFQPSPGLRGEKAHECRCCQEKGGQAITCSPMGPLELGGTCWSSGEHLDQEGRCHHQSHHADVLCQYRAQSHSNTLREEQCALTHTTHIHQSQTNYSQQVKAKPVSVLEECTEYLITLE